MACDLIGVDCMEPYLPHRVGMQFAMDQDIPDPIIRLNDDLELALSSYEKSLDGLKIYIPPRWLEGDVTINYHEWWRSALSPCDHESLTIHDKQRRSVGKVVEVSGVPACSTPCNEAMVLISAGSRKETPNDNPSYIPEIAIQKNPSNVFDKNKQISTIDLTVWSQDTGKCEHNVVEEGEENEVCKSKLNANEGSKPHMECIHLQNDSLAEDHETLNREETLLDTTLNTICYTSTKDEHTEAANHSTDIKQVNSAADAFLIINNGEDNDSRNPFEESILEFEARISKLERTVSTLKTAKFGSSMR
ncbi:uncharacterized protein LOC110723535 [Chenopodium quinoa]|uniref:uncharacterized protein LOC110723535 n=1 Tax=Chenopodium quinoa TaxID=63459 RepID=UPI000B76D554|nr:uncharacterized protein LOC110723535 [Chenopodium quinoa]